MKVDLWHVRMSPIFCILVAFGTPLVAAQTKIVGGQAASDAQFPYQVSLRIGDRHFCGASVIEKRWVLTAAHCLKSFNDTAITVVTGSNTLDEGGDEYRSVKIIPHPKYNSILIRNDVGLILVDRDIVYDDKTQPIALANENFVECDYPAVLSGWGKTKHPGKVPNELQYINLTVIDQRECRNTSFRITDKNLCTLNKEGEGACHGDSGGPLVADNVQIGIVSWGRPCAKGRPDVFTRVYSYKEWIDEHIRRKL